MSEKGRSKRKTADTSLTPDHTTHHKQKQTTMDSFVSSLDDIAVTDRFKRIEDTVNRRDSTIERVTRNIEQLLSDMFELRKENDVLKNEIALLKKENEAIRHEVDFVKSKQKLISAELNDLEQYSRRNNIQIFGVPEDSSDENCEKIAMKILAQNLQVEVNPTDIEAAHRVGKKIPERTNPRPVIVRFVNRKDRDRVMMNKRKLKGSRLFVTEDLTRKNLVLLNEVKKMECVDRAWSFNGNITCVMKDKEKVRVNLSTDLASLSQRHRPPPPASTSTPKP